MAEDQEGQPSPKSVNGRASCWAGTRTRQLQGAVLQGTVAIELDHLDRVWQGGEEGVARGKHVADFHKCLVFSFWDNEINIQSNQNADATEDQIAEGTS